MRPDCIPWHGRIDPNGYGRCGPDMAHRVVYEREVAPIAPGMVLDHLCRNRACVNPAHLEPVTQAENLRRGINANRDKTTCSQGHPYSESNTYSTTTPSGHQHRNCRACNRAAAARYKARKASA